MPGQNLHPEMVAYRIGWYPEEYVKSVCWGRNRVLKRNVPKNLK